MKIFRGNLQIMSLILALLPFFGNTQEFFDDIYYNDNEVNYDYSIEEFDDTDIIYNEEEYIYDENFSYKNNYALVLLRQSKLFG